MSTHGRDGTNHTGESRFPCFYHAREPRDVLARYDLEQTRLELIVLAGVPGVLLILSCASLCICTRVIRVRNAA
jgi:hypothetical protein